MEELAKTDIPPKNTKIKASANSGLVREMCCYVEPQPVETSDSLIAFPTLSEIQKSNISKKLYSKNLF